MEPDVGPVQLIVLDLGREHDERVLDRLDELRDAEEVRLLDYVVVHRDNGGAIHLLEGATEIDFEPEVAERLVDVIAPGMAAVVALIDHRWAKPLCAALTQSGGSLLHDTWIGPIELMEAALLTQEP